MNDTLITFHGWVGADVRHRVLPNGLSVASVRVAATPRVKRQGEWTDGETTWFTVTAWRMLADHLRDSVKRGDAIVVHGRLRTETWRSKDEEEHTTLHVEAGLIGHDLTRGTSTFAKTQRPVSATAEVDDEVNELIHEMPEDITELDSWGEPRPAASALAG